MRAKHKRKVQAIFERDPGGWWVASVPAVPGCHTQGRTLAQARERLKEALAVSAEGRVPAVVEEWRFPARFQALLEAFREAVRDAEEAKARASAAQRRAARALTGSWGVSLRDTGDLLGLSHQRVAQILDEGEENARR